MRRRRSVPLGSLALLAALAGAAPARAAIVVATRGSRVTISQTAGGTDPIYVRQSGLDMIVSTVRNGPPVTGGQIPVAPLRKVVIDMRRSGAYPEVRVENVRSFEIEWVMIGNDGNDSIRWSGLNCRRLLVQLGRGVDTLYIGTVSATMLSLFDGGDDADRYFLSSSVRAFRGAELRIRRFEVMDFS
jgi:hypothetical protein